MYCCITKHVVVISFVSIIYMQSWDGNSIGDIGAQTLAEGLKGCANLQKLL